MPKRRSAIPERPRMSRSISGGTGCGPMKMRLPSSPARSVITWRRLRRSPCMIVANAGGARMRWSTESRPRSARWENPIWMRFQSRPALRRCCCTGKYSLAEVYYLTSRYVSWRMVLFGDPLYNPMRGRSFSPPLAHSPTPLPTPPSERPLGDPPSRLAQKHREQKDQMATLVKLLLDAETGSAKSAR